MATTVAQVVLDDDDAYNRGRADLCLRNYVFPLSILVGDRERLIESSNEAQALLEALITRIRGDGIARIDTRIIAASETEPAFGFVAAEKTMRGFDETILGTYRSGYAMQRVGTAWRIQAVSIGDFAWVSPLSDRSFNHAWELL